MAAAKGKGAERQRAKRPTHIPAQATRPLAELRLHPFAQRVPAMRAEEYRLFRADIEKRGILCPLEMTAAGEVLDGRHRLRAASELGLTEAPVRVLSPPDPLAHMLRAATLRRHLSPSQRAALQVELEQHERLAGKGRRGALLDADVATLPRGERSRERSARKAEVSPRLIQDARTVAADPELFEQVKTGKLPVHRAARKLRRARHELELPEAGRLPDGIFQLLLADPPWQLGAPHSDYAPENYYPTLPLEAIKALAVPAAEDAVLFLWAVNSLLQEALDVIGAWGFSYKTNLVWVKNGIGLGVWARYRHELLLVASRGRFPAPEPELRIDSVIEAKRGRHSQKPACVSERLERMYPGASKLELYARGVPRPGWSAWGNELAA